MILGLDLGSVQTGWGLLCPMGRSRFTVIGSGTFEEKRRDSISYDHRCYTMGQHVANILELNPSIQRIFIEDVFVGRNSKTIIKLGHLRGVISHLCIEITGLEPRYINTKNVKRLVGTSGSASKEEIHYMVTKLAKVKPETLDESDAIAVAIAGYYQERENNFGEQNDDG